MSRLKLDPRPIAFLIVLAVLMVIAIFSLASRPQTLPAQSDQDSTHLQVVTSFYPLYFFATQVGGPLINVENITPAGSEPHDYEPTPQQLVQIEQSDLLFFNGGNFEPWVERISSQLLNKEVVLVRTASASAAIEADPHVWLNPVEAKTQVIKISTSLQQSDHEHASMYQANAKNLTAKLEALNQEFAAGLETCQTRKFVTSHAAFGHLAQAYDLEQLPIAGVSPDEEPSSRALAQLANLVKKENIKYIFFETLVSPKLAMTLATETKTNTLVLDPLEGLSQNQIEAGEDYFTVMRQNLANLRLALGCL